MIPKIFRLLLGVFWLQAVYGGYSQVYVQSGAESIPAEYVKYGAPRAISNGRIAALTAPPVGSVLPNVVPCVAPCIVPQTVEALAPVPQNARIISFNTPSAPSVAAPPKDEKTSYEYSYVVYDEDTGDRKAQRELSDGSVVHGEYSFVQPDGYIREVKYTADDLTGFNAVVKSFLPESALGVARKTPEVKNKNDPLPCKETKSEALIVEPEPSKEENLDDGGKTSSKTPLRENYSELAVVPVVPENKASNKSVPQNKTQTSNFVLYVTESPEGYGKHGKHPADVSFQASEYESLDITTNPNAEQTTLPALTELIPGSNKDDCDDKTHTHEAAQATNPQVSSLNGVSAFNDIIKCVQAAIANKNASNISPLTYIILPGTNKIC